MAQKFEGLYSRKRAPRDSAGWTEKDNFAEMGQNVDFAAAGNRTPAINADAAGLTPAASEPECDRARAEPPLRRQKTNIEIAIERRQQLEATGRSQLAGSNRSEPTRPAAAATPGADQPAGSFADILAPEPEARCPQKAGDVKNGLACDRTDAPAFGARVVDHSAPDAGAGVTELHHVREPLPSDRGSSAKKLAAAVIVLLIGTSIGYIAGKGFEPIGAGTIESSGDGLKLRLDSDLRQR